MSALVKYAVLFLLLMLSLKSFVRNNEWKDSESLALAGMRTNPLNAKMYATMGNTLVEKVCMQSGRTPFMISVCTDAYLPAFLSPMWYLSTFHV